MTREAAAGTRFLRAARLLAVAAAVFLVAACGSPSANGGAEDGQAQGSSTAGGGGQGGNGNGNGNGGGDDGTVAWFLPPAGPESPSNNEDAAYRGLDDNDPAGCAAMLDPSTGFFPEVPPGGFVTGERTFYLYKAGAHLCAGDQAAGEAAYQQALAADWVATTGAVNHMRVCNVWAAVTAIVDPGAGPCTLQSDEDTGGGTTEGGGSEPPPATEPTSAPAPAPTGSG